jgi:hypothetical protein
MTLRARIARGAEAGALTAAAVEVSFFVLDLVRLRPLATSATLSGAGVSPAGLSLDLTSVSGAVEALWVAYQLSMLTLAHFAAFATAGVVASLAFDWRRAGGLERYGIVAALCALALLATVYLTSSMGALGTIGMWTILGMMLMAPAIMGAILRMVSLPEAADAPDGPE